MRPVEPRPVHEFERYDDAKLDALARDDCAVVDAGVVFYSVPLEAIRLVEAD